MWFAASLASHLRFSLFQLWSAYVQDGIGFSGWLWPNLALQPTRWSTPGSSWGFQVVSGSVARVAELCVRLPTASMTAYFAKMSKRVFIFASLVLVYAPHSWLLIVRYPWDSYHIFWVKLWPVLPGLVVVSFTEPGSWRNLTTNAFFVIVGTLTLVLVGLPVAVLTRFERFYFPALLGIGIVSAFVGARSYSLFWM